MPRKRTRSTASDAAELNLAPMMNMVMILIPMLALMAVFTKAGVININSPQSAHAIPTADQEAEPETFPRVVVAVSDDGFRITDQNNLSDFAQYAAPVQGCAGAPSEGSEVNADGATLSPTVCIREGTDPAAPLVERLDYAALYNRLLEIRLHWYDELNEDNANTLGILGDETVPYEAIVATMDAARYFMTAPGTNAPAPSAVSDATPYLVGAAGSGATQLAEAQVVTLGAERERAELFPNPVLMLPAP